MTDLLWLVCASQEPTIAPPALYIIYIYTALVLTVTLEHISVCSISSSYGIFVIHKTPTKRPYRYEWVVVMRINIVSVSSIVLLTM